MPALPKGQRHPAELRERAVRMVFEHQHVSVAVEGD